MIIKRFQVHKKIFSDDSLTKKASLNAFTSGMDYFATLLVGLINTPLLVAGLGDYYYGVWQIMNRLFSYLSTINGTSSPLEWTLAKEQSSTDIDFKRANVGSAIIVWALLLPVIGIGGGVIAWFAPAWMHTPLQGVWMVRTVAGLFIISQSITTLSFLPYAILRGQNQGYRRLGLSTAVILVNGGLVWLALYFKTGIIGVSIAAIIQLLISGGAYYYICKKFIPWLGIKKPSISLIKSYLKLSGWFFANDIVANITFASDVVILGLLASAESVTPYTVTKYVPETVISIIAIMVMGILPGLGGIVGKGDLSKASQLRSELFSLTWLLITTIGTSIILWNRSFITLWVGESRYAGPVQNLLIVIVVAQFILIRTDGSIIDLTLKVEKKVILGAISAIVSILIAILLVSVFDLGIAGVSIGMLLGRLLLSLTYPIIVSRFLGEQFPHHIKSLIRPLIVLLLMYAGGFSVDFLIHPNSLSGIKGWIILIFGAGSSTLLIFALALYLGLPTTYRNTIVARVKSLIQR